MNFGAEKVDLRDIRFTPELLRCIPAATARMYSVLPVFTRCDSLGVVMLDFSNLEAIDELVFITGKELQIRAFIELYYAEDGK